MIESEFRQLTAMLRGRKLTPEQVEEIIYLAKASKYE